MGDAFSIARTFVEQHLPQIVITSLGSLAAIIWRSAIITPVQALISYIGSEEYRDRWKISGKYYLYHEPIIAEEGARIRLSVVHVRAGVYKNKATQSDWKRSSDVMYRGDAGFSGHFVTLSLTGVVERYKGIRKTVVLHRIHRPKRKGSNTGVCGKMMGIANDNEIYTIPVIMSKTPLAYETASEILKQADKKAKGIVLRNEVREAIENAPKGSSDFHEEKFHSPFS